MFQKPIGFSAHNVMPQPCFSSPPHIRFLRCLHVVSAFAKHTKPFKMFTRLSALAPLQCRSLNWKSQQTLGLLHISDPQTVFANKNSQGSRAGVPAFWVEFGVGGLGVRALGLGIRV